jgi:UDPglucose--hexose-1-phosphate uridylyltransferase
LKYLAGTELAAGMFANDTLPEEKAKELQAVSVNLRMSVSA